jgi:hypothetical protein
MSSTGMPVVDRAIDAVEQSIVNLIAQTEGELGGSYDIVKTRARLATLSSASQALASIGRRVALDRITPLQTRIETSIGSFLSKWGNVPLKVLGAEAEVPSPNLVQSKPATAQTTIPTVPTPIAAPGGRMGLGVDLPRPDPWAESDVKIRGQFEAEYTQQRGHMEQYMKGAGSWRPELPPPGGAGYRSCAEIMKRWLARCGDFDSCANELKAGGFPALAERLDFVKKDCAGALQIIQKMAVDADSTAQAAIKIVANTNTAILTSWQGINTGWQKTFDESNRAFMSYLRK